MNFIELANAVGIEPRPYQERIVNKTVEGFLKEACKSILVESPTGSGKTCMGLSSLRLLNEIDPKLKFGWVAMRRKLLSQAYLANKKIGVKNIEFVSMFEKNPPKCDLIVTDEAQHDAASTCASLHTMMGAKYSLGLTATPFRTDRIKLSYEKIINDAGIRMLVEEGYLAQFHQYVIPDWTPGVVAERFIADKEKWGKSVIYMKNTQLCEELNTLLQNAGIKSAIVLGSTPLAEQDKIFSDFENGDIQVLINIYLLTEGFDAPDLKTVWVRDSGKLCTMQMAGRVLRKHSEISIKNIVQSEQTWWPFTKTAKAKREFIWSPDGWRGLEANERVEMVSQLMRDRVLTKRIVLPPYLTRNAIKISVNKKGEISLRGGQNRTRNDNPLVYLLGGNDMDVSAELALDQLDSAMGD